tara:strand:+ start:215 stop:541 length:327 start_codon:yes stop_codon:yes gene_type:complete
MWLVAPQHMCTKHLLGEHVELHMLMGCIEKEKSLKGYINTGLIDISQIPSRHEQLVEEMTRRNYNHESPLLITEKMQVASQTDNGYVDISKSIADLSERCKACETKLM